MRGVDWVFNAWGGLSGGLYFPWDQDDLVARKVLEIEGCDRYRAPFVLEGGAIHVDGEGTLITTEECLLNPNRNPHLDKGQLEILLHEYLGVTSVIWLGKGVVDDETDGHVDNLCCFARPGEVVLTWTDDKRDPQYRVSHDAYERLMEARDAQGRRLKVHKLQQPGPLYRTREECADIDVPTTARAAPRWRAPGGLVRELLHRATRRSCAAARSRGATAQATRTLQQDLSRSDASSACRRARSCSAAATFIASRSRCRRGRAQATATALESNRALAATSQRVSKAATTSVSCRRCAMNCSRAARRAQAGEVVSRSR